MTITRSMRRAYERARAWIGMYDGSMASELRVVDGLHLALKSAPFPHTLREAARLRRGGADPDEVDIAFLHYILEMEFERHA